MPKTTIEFNDDATSALDRLSSVAASSKAEVLRNALSLYSFIVDELLNSEGRVQLGIVENDQVRKVIVVPGLTIRKARPNPAI